MMKLMLKREPLCCHWTVQQQHWVLRNSYPSNPGNERGVHFCRRAAWLQKSARIKLLVDRTFGDKSLSIIQRNCSIKAVKDKKMPKWWKGSPILWLPMLPLYSNSGDKTVDAASVKKALATSQPIFKPKRPRQSSQGRRTFYWVALWRT